MKLSLPVQIFLGIVLVQLVWLVYSRSVDFAARRRRVEAAESLYRVEVCSQDRFVLATLRLLLHGQVTRDGLPVSVSAFDRSSQWDAILVDVKAAELPSPQDLEGSRVIVISRRKPFSQISQRPELAQYPSFRLGAPSKALFTMLGIEQLRPPEETVEPPRAVLFVLAALIAGLFIWLAVLLVRGL